MTFIILGNSYSVDDLLKEDINALKNLDYIESIRNFLNEWFNSSHQVELRTSGSTGVPKRIMMDKEMMRLSARRTNKFFQLSSTSSALLALSCDYIAGKMLVVRALENGMSLIVVPPSSSPLDYFSGTVDFAAFVPMQLSFYKNDPRQLNRISTLILGGTALNVEQSALLHDLDVMAYETYGMTETVSHVALRRVNGAESIDYFTALEGVTFSKDERDTLVIEDLVLNLKGLKTNDLVDLIDAKRFTIRGRYDTVINSGGVKISPEIVENILTTVLPNGFAVSWIEDVLLGQKLVLVTTFKLESNKIAYLNALLPKYHRIKQFVEVETIPLTKNGKIDRVLLHDVIQKII